MSVIFVFSISSLPMLYRSIKLPYVLITVVLFGQEVRRSERVSRLLNKSDYCAQTL